MKIVISDYPDALKRDIRHEVELLEKAFPTGIIVVHPYLEQESFLKVMEDAEGLLTAFLTIDDDLMAQCNMLKCISVNATGYNSIDIQAAKSRNIVVCALRDYCTEEVAEFTLALLLSLAKKIKLHQHFIEEEGVWQYKRVGPVSRLRGKTLAVMGFGRIGQAVAKRAQAFGIEVIAVDPFLPPQIAEGLGVRLVDREYVQKHADIISNHMSVSNESAPYYDWNFFKKLERKPIFINVGRGVSVDEQALLKALDQEIIAAAGLDVLADDGITIASNPLVGRENVIITPHAAFYSDESLKALQDISCQNLIHCLQGELDKINYIVNQ